LDPDKIGFKQPDFGFNGELDFEALGANYSNERSNWLKFMNCVSMFPKHERVKNYIDFCNRRKEERIAAAKTLNPVNESQNNKERSEKAENRGGLSVRFLDPPSADVPRERYIQVAKSEEVTEFKKKYINLT